MQSSERYISCLSALSTEIPCMKRDKYMEVHAMTALEKKNPIHRICIYKLISAVIYRMLKDNDVLRNCRKTSLS